MWSLEDAFCCATLSPFRSQRKFQMDSLYPEISPAMSRFTEGLPDASGRAQSGSTHPVYPMSALAPTLSRTGADVQRSVKRRLASIGPGLRHPVLTAFLTTVSSSRGYKLGFWERKQKLAWVTFQEIEIVQTLSMSRQTKGKWFQWPMQAKLNFQWEAAKQPPPTVRPLKCLGTGMWHVHVIL